MAGRVDSQRLLERESCSSEKEYRKRRVEETVTVAYAKYGMTKGVVMLPRRKLECGIIVDGWPTWGLAALKANFVVMILVRSELWCNRVRNLFPEASVERILPGEIHDRVLKGVQVDIWLSDIEPPRRLSLFNQYPSAPVITRRRARYEVGVTHGYQFFRVPHVDCGGVTDATWEIHVYLPRGTPAWAPFDKKGGRDMCVIVDSKVGGVACSPPAKVNCSVAPKVTEVRPGTYHVSGLYPVSQGPCRIIAPCIYSPTGWVRQRLSERELCAVQDIFMEYFDLLSSKEIAELCRGKVFPLKVALAVLGQIEVCEVGSCTPDESIFSTAKKIRTEGEGTAGTASAAPGEVLGEGGATDFAEANLECGRKLKATKADDAQVPEYLWDNQLVPCGDPIKIDKLKLLRNFALRWSKNHLRRDFLRWFFLKYEEVSKRLKARQEGPYVVWIMELHTFLASNKEGRLDWEAGRDCVARFSESPWWEWGSGSRPHIWRWPIEYQQRFGTGFLHGSNHVCLGGKFLKGQKGMKSRGQG
jgi:hypothetical protein